MNPKGCSFAKVNRRKSNRIHVLASRLRAIRPDLVTLLKLTLLPTVLHAAAERRLPLTPLTQCKAKISSSNPIWTKYVKESTPAPLYLGKAFRKTTHQKTFETLFYDDVNDEFRDGDTLIPHIKMPLKSAHKYDVDKEYIIGIFDNEDKAFNLKFNTKCTRNLWMSHIMGRIDTVCYHRAFWQKVLGKTIYNAKFRTKEAIDKIPDEEFQRKVRAGKPRDRRIFATQFQKVLRTSAGTGLETNCFDECSPMVQTIVKRRIINLIGGVEDDPECIMPLLADIDNLGKYFFKGDEHSLLRLSLWQEPHIWARIFPLYLQRKVDIGQKDLVAWFRSAMATTNLAFFPQVLRFMMADDLHRPEQRKRFAMIKKNTLLTIRRMLNAKVTPALRDEFSQYQEYFESIISENEKMFGIWKAGNLEQAETEYYDRLDAKLEEFQSKYGGRGRSNGMHMPEPPSPPAAIDGDDAESPDSGDRLAGANEIR